MSLLVALDFSAVTDDQLEIVQRLAAPNREVYLLHVAEPDPDFVGFEAGPDVVRAQVADEFHREHEMIQTLAGRLRDRKVAHIESVGPDAVATGNIGCMMQLDSGTDVPVLHTVELLDWATGGPCPKPLEKLKDKVHPIESLIQLAGAR